MGKSDFLEISRGFLTVAAFLLACHFTDCLCENSCNWCFLQLICVGSLFLPQHLAQWELSFRHLLCQRLFHYQPGIDGLGWHEHGPGDWLWLDFPGGDGGHQSASVRGRLGCPGRRDDGGLREVGSRREEIGADERVLLVEKQVSHAVKLTPGLAIPQAFIFNGQL